MIWEEAKKELNNILKKLKLENDIQIIYVKTVLLGSRYVYPRLLKDHIEEMENIKNSLENNKNYKIILYREDINKGLGSNLIDLDRAKMVLCHELGHHYHGKKTQVNDQLVGRYEKEGKIIEINFKELNQYQEIIANINAMCILEYVGEKKLRDKMLEEIEDDERNPWYERVFGNYFRKDLAEVATNYLKGKLREEIYYNTHIKILVNYLLNQDIKVQLKKTLKKA